ncbi:MAG TPA: DUF4381 domain-containing protein [Pseudoxanthomonas sp.]|nr:DUF4381 domain-containing protein [Pseudoxanthomonas sp.]
MQAQELVLRDVHLPVAPSLWPPATGWWLVAALLLLVTVVLLTWQWWKKRRRLAATRLFDAAVEAAETAPAKIAAMSELLRRASRRKDARADRLQGEDWLLFLDKGMKTPVFAAGAGRALAEGGYRQTVGDVELDALTRVARMRFLEWMMAK